MTQHVAIQVDGVRIGGCQTYSVSLVKRRPMTADFDLRLIFKNVEPDALQYFEQWNAKVERHLVVQPRDSAPLELRHCQFLGFELPKPEPTLIDGEVFEDEDEDECEPWVQNMAVVGIELTDSELRYWWDRLRR